MVEKHRPKGKNVRLLSIQTENGNGAKHTQKKRHLKKIKRKKGRNACGCRATCISKNDWTKGRGFNEIIMTKTEPNKRNTRERRLDICKPSARRIQIRATCSLSTMASEPGRARLLWDILSLVFPVTFEHTTACRSPVLAFTAAINCH